MVAVGGSEHAGASLFGGGAGHPVSVRSSRTLLELALWVAGLNTCSVVVTDDGSRVLGVVTALDLLRVIDLNHRNPARALMSVRVGEVARPVPILSLEDDVPERVGEVLACPERCGVVVDREGRPIGAVSVLDALRTLTVADGPISSLASLPASAASVRLRALPSDADVRHAISALVAREGEPLAVGSSGFVVTAQSITAAVLGPQRLKEFAEDPDEVLGSYVLYEGRALVRPAVVSRDMRLGKVVQLMSDSGEQVLRLNDGSFVTAGSIAELFLERLRLIGAATVKASRQAGGVRGAGRRIPEGPDEGGAAIGERNLEGS